MISEENYLVGAILVGIPTFIGTWIYCIIHYGFLLGVGLGWLPSIITAFIIGLTWPLGAFLLACFVVYLICIW